MAYFTRNKAILDRGDRRVIYARVRDDENADMDLNDSQVIHFENRGVHNGNENNRKNNSYFFSIQLLSFDL